MAMESSKCEKQAGYRTASNRRFVNIEKHTLFLFNFELTMFAFFAFIGIRRQALALGRPYWQ